MLDNYIIGSRPKIGWEGEKGINHIQLIGHIYQNELGVSKEYIKKSVSHEVLDSMIRVVDDEFEHLLSTNRRFVIKRCLQRRLEEINNVLD